MIIFKEIKLYKKIVFVALVSSIFTGCASVPMESGEKSDQVKNFSAPPAENSGLYIYRSGHFGGALKKDIWVNGDCIGETAPNMFFYEQVLGNREHKISTESEFSPNDLIIQTEGGKNYFIRQYIKMGAFVGGAGLELVDEEKGKKAISSLNLAKKGVCSSK